MKTIATFKNGLKLSKLNNHYCLTDDYNTDWIIFYGFNSEGKNMNWAHDGYFEITEEIDNYLCTLNIELNKKGA